MAGATLQIEPLRAHHLETAFRLSTQAGWNQLHADWERLITLWPDLCFVGTLGGDVIATMTIARYGAMGWIGMVLVDERHRGAGYARAIFSHATNAARSQGVSLLALDATDQGRPVYLKQGFTDHSRIARWVGAAAPHDSDDTRAATTSDWPQILRLDKRAQGADRGPLLRHLASESGATMRVIEHGGRLRGFGLSRRGRTASTIGPVIAESPEFGNALAVGLLTDRRQDRPDQPVLMDLPEGSPLALPGFTVQRQLVRMCGTPHTGPLITGPMVHAAAGFELG